MDALDDELFGTLLTAKSNLKSEKSVGKSEDKIKKKTLVNDFDEDDPLAGLLSDHDDTDEPVASKGDGRMGSTVKNSGSKDVGSILPESPPTTNRRPNILDNLLAKSDAVKPSESSGRQGNQNFVLGDQYRSFKSKGEDDDLFSFDKNQKERDQSSNYALKLDKGQSESRRPATAIGSNDTERLGLPSTFGGSKVDTSKVRRVRRGISPTVDAPSTQEVDKMARPHTSITNQSPKTRDWLELKDDQQPASITPPQSLTLVDQGEIAQRKSRRAVDSSLAEVSKPNEGNVAAPSGHSDDRLVFTEVDKAENNQQDQSKGNLNFLDWFSNKAKEGNKKPVTSSEKISNVATNPQSSSNLKVELANFVPPVREQANSYRDLSEVILDYESKLSSMRSQMAELHAKFSEDSLNSATEVLDLKTKVRRLEFEKQQLTTVLDGLENRHKEELATLESSFKKRTQLIEDSYQRREKSLQEELEAVLVSHSSKQAMWERERTDLVAAWKCRVDEAIQDRVNDLERIKELHRQTISNMKRDHDLAIIQLRDIKQVEMDAMTEAQSHATSLRSVIDQLVANTAELGRLQTKVDSGHLTSKEEMGMLLESKDKQLKMVQEQLQKQREENDHERTTLKEHILRLENQLHQQKIEVEEAQWKLKQEQNHLNIDRKAYEESLRMSREKLDSERHRLKAAKEEFSEEQKVMLEKIQAEKSRMLSSIVEFGDTQRLPWTLRDMKTQAEYDAALKAISEEKHRLKAHDEHLKLEANRLEAERRALEREEIDLEKTRTEVRDLALQVKQRSEELEEMGMAAVQTREEGFAALQESEKQKSEIRKQQEQVKNLMENVEIRERNLAEERLNLAKDKKQLEKLKSQLLCVQCQFPILQNSRSTSVVDSPNPVHLSPHLLALKVAAEKDMEYLQRESVFLKTLRAPSQENFFVTKMT